MKKIFARHSPLRLYVLSAFVFAIAVLGIVAQTSQVAKAQTSGSSLNGWAWSSNVGWVSFNSKDDSSDGGVSYEVDFSTTTGALSGYAWSSNIGWISFQPADVAGCPNGTCNPSVNMTTGAVTGWARAVRGEDNGSLTGNWDGWIELSGTNHTSPDSTGKSGVTYNTTTGTFNGYAWGSDVIGWLSFDPSGASPSAPCNPSNSVCNGPANPSLTPSVTLSINPTTVATGTPATLSWNTQNITSCTEVSSGISTDDNWNGSLPGSVTSSGSQSTSAFSATGTEAYSLSCTANAQAGEGSLNSNYVTLTVTGSGSGGNGNGGGSCPAIANATFCSNTSGTSSVLESSCPASQVTTMCEWTCGNGYRLANNQCIASGTIQEQ